MAEEEIQSERNKLSLILLSLHINGAHFAYLAEENYKNFNAEGIISEPRIVYFF